MMKSKYLAAVLLVPLAALVLVFSCKGREDDSGLRSEEGDGEAVAPAAVNPAANIPPRFTATGVWDEIKRDPYVKLPVLPVTLGALSTSSFNPSPDALTDRAVTTVGETDNIVQPFAKLVHANGICVRGRWLIDTASPFTGAFAQGTDKAFIGRISVAFGAIRRDDYRAFGFAGKIFHEGPDLGDIGNYQTANFFTIDDLAGTKTLNFHDVELSNEPALTKTNLLKQGVTIAAIGAATVVAFKLADSHPGIRQLYEISELGLDDATTAVTPKWMHLKGLTRMQNGFPDFRRDLAMDNYPNGMTYAIKVSSTSQAATKPIGRIVIEETLASSTCDHRLHFHHPKFRNDLRHQ